jgi:asparagine synthase (glutamine-hydrolysing)
MARYYRRLPNLLQQQVIPALVNRLPVSTNNISLDFRAKRFISGMHLSTEERHHLWLGSFAPEGIDETLTPATVEAARQEEIWMPVRRHAANTDAHMPLNRVLYLDVKMYLENDILAKVDRASMAHSLEARVPLLNRVFIDAARRLPFEWKLRATNLGLNTTSKYLFKQAIAPFLPSEILERRKKGFNMPVAKWFKGELRGFIEEVFTEQRIRDAGLFEYCAVRRLLDDHFSGRRDNRKPLWTLLIFELWREHWGVAG